MRAYVLAFYVSFRRVAEFFYTMIYVTACDVVRLDVMSCRNACGVMLRCTMLWHGVSC